MLVLSWFSLQWKTKNNLVSNHILHFIKRKSKKILFIQQWYAPVLFMNKMANFTAIEANWSLVTTNRVHAITKRLRGMWLQAHMWHQNSHCEYEYDYDRILIKNTCNLSKLIVSLLLFFYGTIYCTRLSLTHRTTSSQLAWKLNWWSTAPASQRSG